MYGVLLFAVERPLPRIASPLASKPSEQARVIVYMHSKFTRHVPTHVFFWRAKLDCVTRVYVFAQAATTRVLSFWAVRCVIKMVFVYSPSFLVYLVIRDAFPVGPRLPARTASTAAESSVDLSVARRARRLSVCRGSLHVWQTARTFARR